MRRGAEIVEAQQLVLRRGRLADKGVAGGGFQLAGDQRMVKVILVDDRAARRVDKYRVGLTSYNSILLLLVRKAAAAGILSDHACRYYLPISL